MGWDRYDTLEAVEAMNDLYRNELRWWLNLFQPSAMKKVRVGSRLCRRYDLPRTPLDRLVAEEADGPVDGSRSAALVKLRQGLVGRQIVRAQAKRLLELLDGQAGLPLTKIEVTEVVSRRTEGGGKRKGPLVVPHALVRSAGLVTDEPQEVVRLGIAGVQVGSLKKFSLCSVQVASLHVTDPSIQKGSGVSRS